MKMKILVNIIIATAVGVVLSMPVTARTRTTQTQIKGASMAVPALTVEAVDSTLLSQTVNPSDSRPKAVLTSDVNAPRAQAVTRAQARAAAPYTAY